MPTLSNVTVHITDRNASPLPEHGVHKLPKRSLVSCFIESKTDMPFCVSVAPTSPWPAFDSVPGPRPLARGLEAATNGGAEAGVARDNDRYELLATMRLDGRQSFEKRVIVYLDRASEYWAAEVMLRNRLVYGRDGAIRPVEWVFRDVGIDDMFSSLGLGGGGGLEQGGRVPVSAEEDLADAFGKLGAGRLRDQRVENRAGLIEIVLEKVRVMGMDRGAWRPSSGTETEAASAAAKGSVRDIKHTVGTTSRDTGEPLTSVDALVYEKVEHGTFATFQFFYRSKETLGRFGFPGFAMGTEESQAGTLLKGFLAREKLRGRSGSGLSETRGQRKRKKLVGNEMVEDFEQSPSKIGGWSMNLTLRSGRVGLEKAGGSEEKVDAENEQNAGVEDEEKATDAGVAAQDAEKNGIQGLADGDHGDELVEEEEL